MRRLTMALGVMAAVLLVAGVSAQKNHNFTGTWTADADKNGPPPANGRGNANSDFEIRMDDKTMNVITTRGAGNTTTNSYKLDGSESKNSGRGGDVITTAKWDGDKLVLTDKATSGTTAYWMDGTDLVREVTRPGANGAAGTPTRAFFKKKS